MGILEEINEVLKSLKSDISELTQKVSAIETCNNESTDDAIVFRFKRDDKLNLAFCFKILKSAAI
jgi:prefoldin subunit 5